VYSWKNLEKNPLFRRILAATLLMVAFSFATPVATSLVQAIINTANTETLMPPRLPINATSNANYNYSREIAGIALTSSTSMTWMELPIQPTDIVTTTTTLPTPVTMPRRSLFLVQLPLLGALREPFSTVLTQNYLHFPFSGDNYRFIAVNGAVLVRVPVTVDYMVHWWLGFSSVGDIANDNTCDSEPDADTF